MFKKKPNVKPLAPIRSSDRRKITDSIITEYQIDVPNPEEMPEDAAVKKETFSVSGIGAIRNSLLPEGSMAARVTTTHGPDQIQVSGTIYVGSHPDDTPRVLWLKLNDRMYPTVYTLWRHPKLVPLLHTTDSVVMKMQGGSDLMTPGLAGPPFPVKATQGSTVAVASLSKPSVPMVVGVCEIDVAALQSVQGSKGHAVRGVHWSGDELWSWCANGTSGGPPPDNLPGWIDSPDPVDTATSAINNVQLERKDEEDNETGGVSLDQPSDIQSQTRNDFVQGEDPPLPSKTETAENNLTVKEIDAIFRRAFIYGVHHHKTAHQDDPKHGISFPIPQSNVISNFVSPYLPITTPAQAAQLQIKRTSWKNVTKFIKALDKDKIIKSKDRNGGETVILDIDFDDQQVLGFVPYKLPKKETAGADSGGGGGGGDAVTTGRDPSIGQSLKMIQLYRTKSSLEPIFKAANSDPKALHTSSEIQAIISSYIDTEHLTDHTNKRLVKLDPILANSVFDPSSSPLDRDILAKGTVPRDALTDRIQSICSPFWLLLQNTETCNSPSAKPKAGHPPKIQILLETRSGNKTVTKVSGVEAFHINPQALASELQKSCASSTSVDQLVGSSPKNPVMEILVQGPQQDMVIKALGERGVRRQWVEVINKTKGKKKVGG